MVTSIDQLGVNKIEDISFSFLPVSMYSYYIGDVTLKMKNIA